MDRLCDEVLQLIFFELDDPGPITFVSKRLHTFSQDPYVRASYFLVRYGRLQAIFWALGRGRVINPKVLDILLSCGAHLSRYLAQVAIHHYYRNNAPFIKSAWVRSLSLKTFLHFQMRAEELYGEIPVAKGEDDGSMFNLFLKESRFSKSLRSVKWEDIETILQKYKFIPFCHKDPLMAQFPLALSVEPRLLPLAVENGFAMNSKYRDFVFRKMFEKRVIGNEMYSDEIVQHVRELCRLDPSMFVSRTVAAEVCMEAKTNEPAYQALRRLDKSHDLLFDLSELVTNLIKLFETTRSITFNSTAVVLRQLAADFPSKDPKVRLVLLVSVLSSELFALGLTPQRATEAIRAKLEPLELLPLTRRDVLEVMCNPFVEQFSSLLDYAKIEMRMDKTRIKALVEDAAYRSLAIGCKGKTLRKLVHSYPHLESKISAFVVQNFRLEVDDLPSCEDEDTCDTYEAALCRDFSYSTVFRDASRGRAQRRGSSGQRVVQRGGPSAEVTIVGAEDSHVEDDEDEDVEMEVDELADEESDSEEEPPDLGPITQDTLSNMIRQDELGPTRARRRYYDPFYTTDAAGKHAYPHDALHVGKWIHSKFGTQSAVTAVFMTHALLNGNDSVLQHYLNQNHHSSSAERVPVTLKHFKMLARLGRSPNYCVWQEIQLGAEFFFSEDDYLKGEPLKGGKVKAEVKSEPPEAASLDDAAAGTVQRVPPTSSPRQSKKRPRRSAASSVKSYAIPDSDDDAIMDDDAWDPASFSRKGKKKVESNLQLWIKHLSLLLKDEQKKYKEKRKRLEMESGICSRPRVPKSEFFKALGSHLRDFRRLELAKRVNMHGTEVGDDSYSEEEDEEYRSTTRSKRRKTA